MLIAIPGLLLSLSTLLSTISGGIGLLNITPSTQLAQVTQSSPVVQNLTSFWEMNVSPTDKIAWDHKSEAHAFYTGKGMSPQTSIFGSGLKSTISSSAQGGLSVPGSRINTDGSFTYAMWVRHAGSGPLLGRWGVGVDPAKSFFLSFNATTNGRLQLSYQNEDQTGGGLIMPTGAGNTVSAGNLALVWFAYDAPANTLKISINGRPWTSVTPPSPFLASTTKALDIGHNLQRYGSNATVGRMMYWDGYIPTDAERVDIYNGGSGRDFTYFNPTGFTPPTSPLTLTLENATFAKDADLSIKGLYWLRPYPLKNWNSALATERGDYVWFRSTDHTSAKGGIFMGYSSSPSVLPTTWTTAVSDAQLSASDPVYNWTGLETPQIEHDPITQKFYLYGHAVRVGSPFPYTQTTHVWTSTDLVTWDWQGPAFPNKTGQNHTGYARVQRIGEGNWIAHTLLAEGVAGGAPSRSGTWTSTDGITWTLNRFEVAPPDALNWDVTLGYFKPQRWDRVTFDGKTYLINQYISTETDNKFEAAYPIRKLFEHDGTGTNNNFLQDVQTYEENGKVYVYAKWSYKEPSTIRLFTGTLSSTTPAQ